MAHTPPPSPRLAPSPLGRRARSLWRWLAALGVLFILGPVVGTSGAPVAVASEYQVKAVLLLKFTKYTEWPATAFTNTSAPLVIGLVGTDPFHGELEALLQSTTSQSRPLALVPVNSPAQAGDCHVLFFGECPADKQTRVLNAVQGRPVLTIGQSPGFTRQGGLIQFVILNDSVRFAVNVEATRSSPLRISSKIITLAVPPPESHE